MMTRSRSSAGAASPLRTAALLVGAVFLVVGILGFVPGVTTGYDAMTFAEHDSGAELFGVFQVSVLHNIVHLLFGVAGIAMSRTAPTARSYLMGGGLIYLVLWLYGLLIDLGSDANFVPVNKPDNWLHFGLGLAMLLMGLFLGRAGGRARRA
ncbi:DUF4383 domain-containing protein [Streptomyces sp. NPDC046275]|uniref:DUF4383 domain-containing protein n=1 Tax=Streptomyces sp. NPDC046275 TaxID=3157201 RepID=UPI0033EB4C57